MNKWEIKIAEREEKELGNQNSKAWREGVRNCKDLGEPRTRSCTKKKLCQERT